jgi:hypothetical protein
VGGDPIKQTPSICCQARCAGDGSGPGERRRCFGGPGRVAGGRGEPTQRQGPSLQRGHVPVGEGQQRIRGGERVAEARSASSIRSNSSRANASRSSSVSSSVG